MDVVSTGGKARRGWLGVDLDGTLAYYGGWRGETHIGAPIPAMVERVKRVIAEGRYDVKIFTARVSEADPVLKAIIVLAIQKWCLAAGLPELEVTCVKDYQLVELWDDRAVQVEHNTGRFIGESTRGLA